MVKILASEATTELLIKEREASPSDRAKDTSSFLNEFTQVIGSFWISPGGFVLRSGGTTVSYIPKGQNAVLINDEFDLIEAINNLPEKVIVSHHVETNGTTVRVK